MTDDTANLILVQLREIRSRLEALDSRMAAMEPRLDDGFAEVNGRVDGLTMMIRLLATHTEHLDARVEKLEERFP